MADKKIPSSYEIAILEFVREISKVIVMCNDLKKELDDLKNEMREVGGNFSAKILTNEKTSFFLERYSDIAKNYNAACKVFSQMHPDLEKIMYVEGDVQELINDAKSYISEAEASLNFKVDFEGAEAFIFETIEPMLDRIIDIGKVINVKACEILSAGTESHENQGGVGDKAHVIFFGLMFLMGLAMALYGFFEKHSGSLQLGSILILCTIVLSCWLKWDKQ